MKAKLDFVTNSSSVCFIFESESVIAKNSIIEAMALMGDSGYLLEEFECFETKSQLITFAQGKECDWVTLATGPKYIGYMTPEAYKECEKLISSGKIVVYVECNRNGSYESIQSFIEKKAGKLHYKEFD